MTARVFWSVDVMRQGYFHRVTRETPTRFWINNPTSEEVDLALDAGAISCTTNPAYGSRLLKAEPEVVRPILDRAIELTTDDDDAADRVCRQIGGWLVERFLPLYERSDGREGFVTIQDDPRKEEDWSRIVDMALRCRELGPNFMAKIPVTESGIRAMEALVEHDVPLCATEVFALDQVIAVCDAYERASAKTGCSPPFFVTHIAGIFDQYLGLVAQRIGNPVPHDEIAWAGATVGRAEYRLLRERGYRATMLGGGARGTHHFTDYVGGDIHITINWSTAKELIDADPPVEPRIETATPPEIVASLSAAFPDFALANTLGALPVEEFAEFGPVVLFRNNFISGFEHLISEIAERRAEVTQLAGAAR